MSGLLVAVCWQACAIDQRNVETLDAAEPAARSGSGGSDEPGGAGLGGQQDLGGETNAGSARVPDGERPGASLAAEGGAARDLAAAEAADAGGLAAAEGCSDDADRDCAGNCFGAALEDMCGTCDADPGNDCAQDCAGVWGGAALEDMCGTCDADPGNDCVQDCAGVWGGAALTDSCGTCDAIADNDCVTNWSISNGWSCVAGVACQDVYDFEFPSGSALVIDVGEVSLRSVVQIGLYGPGVTLGGTNLLTGTSSEYRCHPGNDCSLFTDGESAAIALGSAGSYRLAITRDWAASCDASGTYQLALASTNRFVPVGQSLDDVATAAPGVVCP